MNGARYLGFWKELNIIINIYFSSFSISFLAQWFRMAQHPTRGHVVVGPGHVITFNLSLRKGFPN